MKAKKITIVLVGMALPWMTGCALQSDMARLQERMISVERLNQDLLRQNAVLEKQIQDDLVTMGISSETAEKTLRTQYASMNVNLETLQQEMRLLNGRIEEIDYLLNRTAGDFEVDGRKRQERLDELSLNLAKLDQRLIALERYLNLDRRTSAATPPAQPPAAAANSYDTAKKTFDRGEWEKARQQFGQFLTNDPQSDNADNAQFWIGETYYNEQWFEKAILEYQTVIEQYPKGNKVPAAMLKQGLAFLQLGDQSNARLVLRRLTEMYPKSNEASVAQARLKDI